jgi:hypothetical protein
LLGSRNQGGGRGGSTGLTDACVMLMNVEKATGACAIITTPRVFAQTLWTLAFCLFAALINICTNKSANIAIIQFDLVNQKNLQQQNSQLHATNTHFYNM